MAIEAQGVQIRRQSTTAGSTGLTSTDTIAYVAGSTGVTRGGAGSFIADGFTTAMRVTNNSTSNSTRVHTVASVAATVMTFREPIVSQSSGTTWSITGHDMEAIAEIISFSGPSGSAAVIDVTSNWWILLSKFSNEG